MFLVALSLSVGTNVWPKRFDTPAGVVGGNMYLWLLLSAGINSFYIGKRS